MTRPALLVAALALVPLAARSAPPEREPAKRGKYLAVVMGCHDCHTPMKMGPKGPEPDTSRLLSGHPEGLQMPPAPGLPPGPWGWVGALSMTAFSGPWGVSYSANLTPDPETGIGAWTEKTFVDAMRTGKHLGKGRPILPPMPWQNLAAASDDDLKALYAYFRSIPPLKNRVPEPVEPPARR